MPTLNIPVAFRPALEALLALTPEQVSALSARLAEAAPDAAPSDVARSLGGALPDLEPQRAEEIGQFLYSLYGLALTLDTRPDEIARDVIRSAERLPGLRDRIQARGSKQTAEVLARILDVPQLAQSAYTAAVLGEYQRTLHGARILTDIRPVFSEDPDQDPTDLRVVHTLKLTYHTGSATEEIFVKMNASGLELLSDAIRRAQKKESTLRRLIASVPLTGRDGGV